MQENNEDLSYSAESYQHELVQIVGGGMAGHAYKQQGPYLVCTSCVLKHSIFIGVSRHLKGFDEYGMPQFADIESRE